MPEPRDCPEDGGRESILSVRSGASRLTCRRLSLPSEYPQGEGYSGLARRNRHLCHPRCSCRSKLRLSSAALSRVIETTFDSPSSASPASTSSRPRLRTPCSRSPRRRRLKSAQASVEPRFGVAGTTTCLSRARTASFRELPPLVSREVCRLT